jgi:hypothetical protein
MGGMRCAVKWSQEGCALGTSPPRILPSAVPDIVSGDTVLVVTPHKSTTMPIWPMFLLRIGQSFETISTFISSLN